MYTNSLTPVIYEHPTDQPRPAGWRTAPQAAPPHCDAHCDADAFAELASAIARSPDIREARRLLLTRAATMLAATSVALTRSFEDADIGFVVVSDENARHLARIEQQAREGPAWDAHATGGTVGTDDVAAEVRWRSYARAVTTSTGVRSVIALPLLAGPDVLGALVAYSDQPGHFTGERLHTAHLLAAHAGVALGSVAVRVKAQNLEVALHTNREIATAVGIVMDRLRLTDSQAFDHLRELSQRRHVKLVDLAERIVVSGEIPEVPRH